MVKTIFRFFTAFLIFTTSCASTGRTISDLQITSVGQSSGDNDGFADRVCGAFKPTLEQVRHYFRQAYPVEMHVIVDARYSACYATGTITFSDGNSGKWRITSSGAANIVWSTGEYIAVFYKHNNWPDPYECSYGMDDDGWEC